MRKAILVLALLATATAIPFAGSISAQDVQITPYGFVLFNVETNDHIATDIPVRAAWTDTGDGRSTTLLTARQSRFGLKTKTEVEGWTVAGVIELDFWGQKGSFNTGASMQSAPRLRLANFSMKKNNVLLLFGQDWSVFAPLSPNSLIHVSIPSFSSSGNLWNRFPQARLDYTASSDTLNKFLIQVAAVRPNAADVTSDSQAELLGAGEYSGLPFGQARLAFLRGKSFVLGGSGHVGQVDFHAANPAGSFEDEKTTTWGVAADVKVAAGQIAFAGEGYVGSNLGMMFSNAGTRVFLAGVEDPTQAVEGIDVKGGWGELTFRPSNSKVSFNGGAGVEVLDDDQIEEMLRQGVNQQLSQNLTVFGNVQYDPISKVAFALEVGYIQTTYKFVGEDNIAEDDRDNLNVGASARLSF